jgi:hypothetical protein
MVFENRVLGRIFEPKKEKVAEGWRRLHNVEIHNLYTSPNIIMAMKSRRMLLVGLLERMGEMRSTYKILIEESEGKRLGRIPRHTWEYII